MESNTKNVNNLITHYPISCKTQKNVKYSLSSNIIRNITKNLTEIGQLWYHFKSDLNI